MGHLLRGAGWEGVAGFRAGLGSLINNYQQCENYFARAEFYIFGYKIICAIHLGCFGTPEGVRWGRKSMTTGSRSRSYLIRQVVSGVASSGSESLLGSLGLVFHCKKNVLY